MFFTDYHFKPAVECFHFPHEPLRDYLWFVAHLFSYSVGIPCSAHRASFTKGFGTLLLLMFVVAAASRLWKLARAKQYEPINLVVVVFIGFTFMFAVNAAVGRVCIGSWAANAERYQALLIPAWLRIYLTVAALGMHAYRVTACLLILSLCFLLPQARGGGYESGMRY